MLDDQLAAKGTSCCCCCSVNGLTADSTRRAKVKDLRGGGAFGQTPPEMWPRLLLGSREGRGVAMSFCLTLTRDKPAVASGDIIIRSGPSVRILAPGSYWCALSQVIASRLLFSQHQGSND